jgi:hypothetical protein
VNTSAPALTREDEVQSKIRKVSAFGRHARVVCSALFGFGLVGIVFIWIPAVLGVAVAGPDGAVFTAEQKWWGLAVMSVTSGVGLAIVYQLYRLFGNLAAGTIYSPETIRRVRYVGLLSLLWAALGILIPMVWTTLAALAFVDPASSVGHAFSLPETLSAFMSAGLILLVSWIMDVGLYEKDHAAELQRDADLVI